VVISLDILFLNVGEEMALASTKSYVSTRIRSSPIAEKTNTNLIFWGKVPPALYDIIQNSFHRHREVVGILSLGA